MNEVIEFSCIASKEYNVNCPGFIRGKKGINLVKLHGSLSEHEYKDEPLICNLRLNKSSSQELMDDFRKVLRMAYYHQGHKIPSGPDRAITDKNGQLSTLSKAILTGGKKYSKTAKPKEGAVISG